MMEIQSMFQAYHYVLNYLERNCGFKTRSVKPINEGRYYIIYSDQGNICIIYKKSWFLGYGDILKNDGAKGIGDSVNVYDLQTMIQQDVKKIYICHISGTIYYIDLFKFLIKSISWVNKEAKEVRSISIHEYERVNKNEETDNVSSVSISVSS